MVHPVFKRATFCGTYRPFRTVRFIYGSSLLMSLDRSLSTPAPAQVSFALHPNGLEIVTASRSLLLRHWDIATGVCKRAIKAHDHIVRCMDYDGWVEVA